MEPYSTPQWWGGQKQREHYSSVLPPPDDHFKREMGMQASGTFPVLGQDLRIEVSH